MQQCQHFGQSPPVFQSPQSAEVLQQSEKRNIQDAEFKQ